MKMDNLSFMNIVKENDKRWFVNECWNALFLMDEINYELTYIDFPKYSWGGIKQYKWLAKWKNRFVCISNYSDMPLYIIDGVNAHFMFWLPKAEYMIREILQYNQYIYFFTNNVYISVIKYNIEKNEIVESLSLDNKISKKENLDFRIGNVVLFNNAIWGPVVNTNWMIEIACDTFDVIMHNKLDEIKYRWPFAISDNFSYALGYNTEMNDCIIINNLNHMEDVPKIFDLSKYINRKNFSNIRADKNVIWLFPNDNENILKLNLLTRKFKELTYPKEFLWIKDRRYVSGIRFTCIEEQTDKFILYPRTGNGILLIDKYGDTIKYCPLYADMNKIKELQIEQIEKKNISILRDDLFVLSKLIVKKNGDSKKTMNGKNIGFKIYKNIINAL